MRHTAFALMLAAAVSACGGDHRVTEPPPDAPVLLRDIVVPRLPSPYYHFEYDATGRITSASFASGLTRYAVSYDGNRITELRNTAVADGARLTYLYDDAGRPAIVRYVDAQGVVFTRVVLTYDGPRLVGLERERRLDAGFIIDKTLSFTYHADGNVFEITDHRPPVDGLQEASTSVTRFEQYDDKINVDGFSLLHTEFFDQLILLPGVQLQKGNAARESRGGDGVSYSVDYSYRYDDRNRPLVKLGELTFLNGENAGQRFETRSEFSYY